MMLLCTVNRFSDIQPGAYRRRRGLQPRVYPKSRVLWWLHELSAYIDQLQSLMGDSLLKESKNSDGFSWLMGDGSSPPNIGHYS